jgi:hypothetical protein
MPDGQCGYCKPPPLGGPRMVVVTSAGQVYHGTAKCPALLDGWAIARRWGRESGSYSSIAWSDAVAKGLAPCSICGGRAYSSSKANPGIKANKVPAKARVIPKKTPVKPKGPVNPKGLRVCSACGKNIQPGQLARVAGRDHQGQRLIVHATCPK